MTVEALVDSYYGWLRDNTTVRQASGGWTEVQTPFLDRHNDAITIYIRMLTDRRIELSDDSYTLNDLEMCGVAVDASPKRRELLETILRSHGVSRDGDDLIVRCAPDQFLWKKHNFLQAILEVNDMFNLSKPSVQSFFVEDVFKWCDEHQVLYAKDLNLVGRSGFSHHFDLVIPTKAGSDRPERLVRAVNHPDKNAAVRLMHASTDLRETRPRAETVAILNDERGVPGDVMEALNEYQIRAILWKEREQALTLLRPAA